MNNLKVLVTSGGTKVPIDLVRDITNKSKGTFGSKIAQEFKDRNHDVTFFYARGSKYPVEKGSSVIHYHKFITFDDYSQKLDVLLKEQPDIVVLAAAVSDYGVENVVNGKIRSDDELIIRLKPLPKLISAVRSKCPKAVICGFKLLVNSTDDELYDAVEKSIKTNDCDLVVGNDWRDISEGKHRLILGMKKCYNKLFKVQFDIYHREFDDLAKVVVNSCLKQYEAKV